MIPKTASHYQILEKLGGGGMGVVYRARDLKLDRFAALKFLPSHFGTDEEKKERFLHEAKAASALDHPHIGTIYEIDETEDGQLFIAMAFYDGETLKKKIARGPLPMESAVDIALQVTQGLAKVHEQGIVHRDIKPANLMLTRDGAVKIVDFGLAKLAGGTRITKTGTTMGTVAYMSPEQALGESADHRTDLWSTGVVLYEMVTGQLPFKGDHEQAVIHSILNREPEPMTTLRSEVPAELELAVRKALAKKLRDRYQHADEMGGDLILLAREQESVVTVQRPSAPALSPVRRSYGYAAVALAVLLFAAGIAFLRGRETRRIEAWLAGVESAAREGRLDEVFQELQTSGLDLNDSRLNDLSNRVAGTLTIETEPSLASVTVARVQPIADFAARRAVPLGNTPLAGHRLVAGEYWLGLTHEQAGSLQFLVSIQPAKDLRVTRQLLKAGAAPEGMVLVEEGKSAVGSEGSVIPGFLIDQHEVTNEEFLNFVSSGGYRDKSLWDKTPSDSVLHAFVDRTGVPGPRFWSGGTYPAGKKDNPVVGISWYEASAYARWTGKELPSSSQWWRAALGDAGAPFPWGRDAKTAEIRANFELAGTRPVGSYPLGVSPFGCLDMAGNVREWLRDTGPDPARRVVVGGSWQDPVYMFEPDHAEWFAPAFANEAMGFRCVKSVEPRQ